MFKRKGGGIKGLLNNVKKNCTFLTGWLPLSASNFFRSYAQNVIFDVKKQRTKLPELGSGGGGCLRDSGNARKKTFFLLMSSLVVTIDC